MPRRPGKKDRHHHSRQGATYSLSSGSSNEDNVADGDLDIGDNPARVDLIILVQGGGTATIAQDASPDDRVLHFLGGSSVRIEGLTLTGGSSVAFGGGVLNEGTLALGASTISDNTATSGSGVYNEGELTLDGSIISHNTASDSGGGQYNAGTSTVTRSAFLANDSPGEGDGIFSDIDMPNPRRVARSCIVGNGDAAVYNNQPAFQAATRNW
jgi:hypothetical protein